MNSETQLNDNLKRSVLHRIESGEIKMRTKTFFVLKICLLVFVILAIFLSSVLLISYILFSLRVDGHLLLLGFGVRGFYEFIMVFPWLLLVVNVVLLLFLDALLKRFRFGYHNPIIYLFLGTLVLITGLGSLFNYTSFHLSMMKRAERKNLHIPIAGGMYSGLRMTHKDEGIFRGVVDSIEGNTFTLRHNDYDVNQDDIRVVAPSSIDIANVLEVGDQVFVAGDMVNGEIHAYGIQRLSNDEYSLP